MKTVQDAVDHYLPKKKSGEMSMSDIRHELTENSDFSEVEINSICYRISDSEIEGLGEKKMFKFDFTDNVIFSVFMILATIAIFIWSFLRFKELREAADGGAEIADVDFFLPGAFMLVSIIYLVRHIFRIIKKVGQKKD